MKKIYLKDYETFDYFVIEDYRRAFGEDAVGVYCTVNDGGFWKEVIVREDEKGYFYYEDELYED